MGLCSSFRSVMMGKIKENINGADCDNHLAKGPCLHVICPAHSGTKEINSSDYL